MAPTKCAVCGKTAYPLESVTAIEKTYHKICFKCDVCSVPLSIKNYKGYQGKVYCFTHTPVERSSTGSDGLATQNALKAPKKKLKVLELLKRELVMLLLVSDLTVCQPNLL